MDQQQSTSLDTIKRIWTQLELPREALPRVTLQGDGILVPSSFKIGLLAQSSIALSALAAALIHALRHQTTIPEVSVPLNHALIEFKSEAVYTLNGEPAPPVWGLFSGLHKTSDGYIRMHDSFSNHHTNALKVLRLPPEATREDVSNSVKQWKSNELETTALQNGAVMYALRSYEEWDALPQSRAVADFPIPLHKISNGVPVLPSAMILENNKCLSGLRVVEMSRVIAAPVAGKTLAVHGADVIWVTSPNLPDLPNLDIDLGRGKRTVQLDIKKMEDKAKLLELLRTADVFIQSYRPGSLASLGLSTTELVSLNPNLVVGNLSAFGTKGPWSQNRGFDSLVQTCTGMNVSEAEHFGEGEAARPMPCQALDHGAGYLLATGIMAALYKRATEGGAYEVNVSLAGVMKYLRSLGQYPDNKGFYGDNILKSEDVHNYLERRTCGFGELNAVKHSATIDGVDVGWHVMPKPLGSDEPVWIK